MKYEKHIKLLKGGGLPKFVPALKVNLGLAFIFLRIPGIISVLFSLGITEGMYCSTRYKCRNNINPRFNELLWRMLHVFYFSGYTLNLKVSSLCLLTHGILCHPHLFWLPIVWGPRFGPFCLRIVTTLFTSREPYFTWIGFLIIPVECLFRNT